MATWQGNYVALSLTRTDVEACAHSGRNDDDVEEALRHAYVVAQFDTLDPNGIRSELREYGAWDDAELADEAQNRARLLWCAAWSIREERCW